MPLSEDLPYSLYTSGGTPVSYMCPNTHYHIYLTNNSNCSLSNYTWSVPSTWSINYTLDNMISFDENAEWGVEIFDQMQVLKEQKIKLKGKELKIQTTGWKAGIYIVRVKYKDEYLQGKLVVN